MVGIVQETPAGHGVFGEIFPRGESGQAFKILADTS